VVLDGNSSVYPLPALVHYPLNKLTEAMRIFLIDNMTQPLPLVVLGSRDVFREILGLVGMHQVIISAGDNSYFGYCVANGVEAISLHVVS
jgi:hypothetical protein